MAYFTLKTFWFFQVVSYNRWLEYVHVQFRRLTLLPPQTDLCNACYKVKCQLKEPGISDARRAELLQEQEVHLEDAKVQRRAMNDSVKQYQQQWGQTAGQDPCVISLDEEEGEGVSVEEAIEDVIVMVTCEDYGQAIPLPYYGASRPNSDYFNSNLHLHMFNISNCTIDQNYVYLYDERVNGKDGNAVCSLRWYYHCGLLQMLIDSKKPLPKMALKIMDNCSGQNKSVTTVLFDALLSLLLYDRVGNFYLMPGHSHMRPDRVTAWCKNSLKRKDLFLPEQVSAAMDEVAKVNAEVLDASIFFQWEGMLRRYFTPPPPGFTSYYTFEFVEGKMVYKKKVDDDDASALTHILVTNVSATRRAILLELFDLEQDASVQEIIGKRPSLTDNPGRPLTNSKAKSVAKKLGQIPEQYHAFYPSANLANAPASSDEEVETALEPAVTKKRRVGRPKKSSSSSSAGQPCIVRFLLAPSTSRSAPEAGAEPGTSSGTREVSQPGPSAANPARNIFDTMQGMQCPWVSREDEQDDSIQ